MKTKRCMRSGKCCSSMLAVVPKFIESNLDPDFLDSLPEGEDETYLAEHAELMGTPCKWLVRDEITTEATCKVYERRGDDCRNYPADYSGRGDRWCPVGLAYWKDRKNNGQPIPQWVEEVLENVKG